MSSDALTSTGDNLRRVVVRAVGTFALGAVGLALWVTLAAPASAADGGPLGSLVGDTEPVGVVITDAIEKPVAKTAEVVEQVSDPVLKPVTEQVGEALRPVTEPVAPVTGGLLVPVADTASPVTDIVGGVTTPIVQAVKPATAPVTDALAPVLVPVGEVVAPVGEALEPVVEPLSPVVEPPAPAPVAPMPELPPVEPSTPGEPTTVIPAVQARERAEPTYPGALQASGDVAGVVVRTHAGVRHAMLDLVGDAEAATTVDTVLALSVVTAGVIHAGGPSLFGAGFPLAAGGAANAIAAGAGGLLGGGAPQLKVLGGEPFVVLSALLVFRARSWPGSTDESRGKRSSIYADIPVSPA